MQTDPAQLVHRNRSQRGAARMVGFGAAVVAAPAAVLAAPFWAVGALVRRLPEVLSLEPATTPWTELLQYAPEVGWRPRPHLDAYAVADDVFHITTDAEGWRGAATLDEADVVVFGDSFAFGHGVDDEDMYSEHVPGRRIKPLGSDGYSMVHAVLWMRAQQSRLAGKRVLWMVYPGNDLYDNLRPSYGQYRMPYVRHRNDSWEVYTEHVSPEPWPIPGPSPAYPTELARMCTDCLDSDRALDAAGYLMSEAHRICSQVGTDLTVLSVPRRSQIDPGLLPGLKKRSPDPGRFDPGRPDAVLRDHAQRVGCQFVSLADHLSPDDYYMHDIHWRPIGHQKVAAVIADLLRDSTVAAQLTATNPEATKARRQ